MTTTADYLYKSNGLVLDIDDTRGQTGSTGFAPHRSPVTGLPPIIVNRPGSSADARR